MDLTLFSRLSERETLITPLELSHSETLNGLETLTFTTLPLQDFELEKYKRVILADELGVYHEFIIEQVESQHDENGHIISVYCESSITETLGDFIEDKRPYNQTVGGALRVALEGTRWQPGRTENTELQSTNFYRISVHEALGKILETWGGEIQTRVTISGNKVTGRYVDILNRRGADRGRRFEWHKDLSDFKKTVSSDPIYTALYGYGKSEEIGDGYGRRISFASINGGKAYVENPEARDLYGPPNPDGTHRNIFGKFECDAETAEETLELTLEELAIASNPKVKYEGQVVNLAQYGFEYEGVELGDDVTVIDDDIGTVKARVVKLVKKLDFEQTEIVLGNYRDDFSSMQLESQKAMEDFASRAAVWDRANAFGPDGKLKPGFLQSVLDIFNAELNASGGYVYAEDGQGLSAYNKPIDEDPTGVTQLLAGGLRIASSKLADGSWDWKTAITSLGIVADIIYTGRIVGQTSFYDLDAGLLEFTAELGGKEIKVRLSVADGFQILENGKVIGGLGLVDGRVMLITNAMSNNPDAAWAELGQVTYKPEKNSLDINSAGIKMHYKDDSGKWHHYALCKHLNNTGVVMTHDGKQIANFREDGFYLTHDEDQGDRYIHQAVMAMPGSLKVESMTMRDYYQESAATLSLYPDGSANVISQGGNISLQTQNGALGIDDQGPWYHTKGFVKKYLT